MREYKMGRGEYLEDRVDDFRSLVAEYFGPVTDTEAYNGSELWVVTAPDNPVFDRVVAGAVGYNSKKDRVALNITERPAEELIAAGDVDAAGDAIDLKNEFLKRVTGRDAEARRNSMKRDVEDDDAPDSV
jgi:hypothetical protein